MTAEWNPDDKLVNADWPKRRTEDRYTRDADGNIVFLDQQTAPPKPVDLEPGSPPREEPE